MTGQYCRIGLLVLILSLGGASTVGAQASDLPPRTVGDITAILDAAGPPPEDTENLTDVADAEPPRLLTPLEIKRLTANAGGKAPISTDGVTQPQMSDFYRKRGMAAFDLGRLDQSIDDLRRALDIAALHGGADVSIARNLAFILVSAGQFRSAVEVIESTLREGTRPHHYIQSLRGVLYVLSLTGEIERAVGLLDKIDRNARRAPVSYGIWKEGLRAHISSMVNDAHGRFALETGDFEEADARFALATAEILAAKGWYYRGSGRRNFEKIKSQIQLAHADTLIAKGSLVEAEILARQVLLDNLERVGKFSVPTVVAINALVRSIGAQGRFADAEQLGQAAEEIMVGLGATDKAATLLVIRLGVARALAGQGRWPEAADIVRGLAAAIGDEEVLRNRILVASADPAMIYFRVGESAQGLRLSEQLAERHEARYGDKHYLTAEARGFRAIGRYLTGAHDTALEDFRAAIPILLASSRQVERESTVSTARELRRRTILDFYIALLADLQDVAANPELAAEAFRISDAGRGSSVQRAVAQSSLRAAARDPELAEVVRREQDLLREISALFGLLTNVLSASADQRDAGAVQDLRDRIDRLRGERAQVREDLEARFPDYVRLIDPRPARLEDVRAALADDEAAVMTYVTDVKTYVWAFGKAGPVAFAATPLGRERIAAVAAQLRRSLDPAASTLADIPDFDTGLASRLYDVLLAPVADGWQAAAHLVVVADGPLGQVPFSLLPTKSDVPEKDTKLLFDRYRDVAWLTRTHSVTVMPSAASVVALRALPPSGGAQRSFVGFGDPFFHENQVAAAVSPEATDQIVSRGGISMRNVPVHLRSLPKTRDVSSADLGRLPRLPDTADEIRAMSEATRADPERDVFLGRSASEPALRQTPLGDYRVVAFATHGLVPGDLNGLVEPALAMTAPGLAEDADGDGLLTMGEIFELELNADWVVLSACNTGTADGAGAEAVSGLGRAFFYAGTRALLVSNWPVETTSARILTTDVFARQAANTGLSRAEALRQAQVALIDNPGFVDTTTGKPVFSYAHPIFWAPFSLIGEGSGVQAALDPAAARPSTPAPSRGPKADIKAPASPQQPEPSFDNDAFGD